jgi:hypothetical protein
MERLLARIAGTPGCRVLPPSGIPAIGQAHALPTDLAEFYEKCGGVVLFSGAQFPLLISPPSALVSSNQAVVGEPGDADPSASWYVIADDGSGQRLSIDLSPNRVGRCYDSFVDTHAVAGSCAVVAVSFTDLLVRLLAAEGGHWYWAEPGFVSLGDAYDIAPG